MREMKIKDFSKLYKMTNGYFKFFGWEDGISKLVFLESKIPVILKEEYINKLKNLDYDLASKEQTNDIDEKVFLR